MNQPSGTVTFLFTDIEGSAAKWERHPDAMRIALARHDALLSECIGANSGHVFKTVGDAFCAAFDTASGAVAAANAIALAIGAENWPEPIEIKVRMAMHTGAAELRGGDYFGQPLNRVARLLSAGHGGQILLSHATEELVRDHLGDDLSLVDLGEWRLKDLVRPERVFQLAGSDLPSSFPALRTLDALKHNLPMQLTSFVGREAEVAEVEERLRSSRLVTLLGAGGAGKTRLALHVGADAIENFADGVWFVELASTTDPEIIASSIASALGLKEQIGIELIETVKSFLSSKRALLILDNCEHLVADCARHAEELLRRSPELRILATSREALNVAGEQIFRVPSLSMPDSDPNKEATVESIGQFEAVRLFIERATLSAPGFSVTNQNAPALAELCVRLDGIPLAIELAAARCPSLSVEDINDRLGDRFRLLTGGSRTAVPRQKTLRALVDWSYDLLSDAERTLLCRASVFSGSWNLEMAERILPEGDEFGEHEVLDLLASLGEKSLAICDVKSSGSRYRFLQTVRQYGQDRLREIEPESQVHDRHRHEFFGLVERANAEMRGSKQVYWLDRLDEDHDNIRAALQWSFERGDPDESGLLAVANTYFYWWVRGHWAEGRTWYDRFLGLPPKSRTSRPRAAAGNMAGSLALYQGDYDRARSLYLEAMKVHEELGDKAELSASYHSLAHVDHLKGDLAAAQPLYERSLAIRRELGNDLAVSQTMNNLANLFQELGQFDEARAMHEQNLVVRRSIGVKQGISQTLQNIGCLLLETGMIPDSTPYFSEALSLSVELRDVRSASQSIMAFAEIGLRTGRANDAAILWGAAESMRESIGAPLYEIEKAKHGELFARGRADLGDEAFDAAWNEGRSMSMDEASASIESRS